MLGDDDGLDGLGMLGDEDGLEGLGMLGGLGVDGVVWGLDSQTKAPLANGCKG